MAITFRERLNVIPSANGIECDFIVVGPDGTEYAAKVRKSGYVYFQNVNTPGRDLSYADIIGEKVLRNVGAGSTPLLLRPLALIPTSEVNSTPAGLTGARADTSKPYFKLRREVEGFFTVNPYQPTNFGPIGSDATLVTLSAARKYDHVTRGGVPKILMTEPYSTLANWVTEGVAGLTAGTPRVELDWGEDDVNDPNNLPIGHAPVTVMYLETVAGVDYWGTA